jgi:hypothetical protein
VDFLLESLQGFADTFSDLRQAAGSENDQDDHQDDDQFGYAHRPEHGIPSQPATLRMRGAQRKLS